MKFLKTHTGAMVVLAVVIVLSVLLGSPPLPGSGQGEGGGAVCAHRRGSPGLPGHHR
ncbi:hypothetical protein M5E87_27545 [Flavonifractor plautii]|nr:hypothetical protein M5E87_27545 [Flavonifractor plautii]